MVVPLKRTPTRHTCCKNKIVVVHNGIIENYVDLKKQLIAKGHKFKSQTDTEVLAHLVEDAYEGDLAKAVLVTLKQVQGSYAIGVLSADDPSRFIAARRDSPLVLGVVKRNVSRIGCPRTPSYTRRVIFLEDGDIAELTQDGIRIFDLEGRPLNREPKTIQWDALMAEKAATRTSC